MQGRQTALVGAAAAVVIVDGTGGSRDKPVTAWVRPQTGTIWLGGADADATHGLSVASTDQPLKLEIIGEHLYAFAASNITVNVLRDSA